MGFFGGSGGGGGTGPQGLSAYQIWLGQGNTGTTADFLNSLKGPKGDTGAGGSVTNYATLADLQAAYPSGTTTPAWVVSDNAWYYWSGTTTNNPPSAPTGLTANPSNTQVALTWSSVTGATSYKVYRNGTSIGTPTSASYTDTGLTNGTSYSYTVSAVNANGESSQSSSVSATPVAPAIPSAPTGLTATAGNAQVALSWTATSGATGYKVYRGGTLLASPTTNSYTDTTVTNGTSYSYTVSATNTSGESSQSSAATATPQVSIPSTPTGLAATSGDTQVVLNWATVNGATGYNVYRGGVLVSSPTTNTYTDTGLTDGTSYSYTVSATNTAGESAQSAPVSATPVSTTIPAGQLSSVWSGILHSFDLRTGSGTTAPDSVGSMPMTLTNYKSDGTEGWVSGGLTSTGTGYAVNSTAATNLGITTPGSSFTLAMKVKIAANGSIGFFSSSNNNNGINTYVAGTESSTLPYGRFALCTIGVGALHVQPAVKYQDGATQNTIIRDDASTAASTVTSSAAVVVEVTYDHTTKTMSLYLNGTLNKSYVATYEAKFDGFVFNTGTYTAYALLVYNRVLSSSELTQVSSDLLSLS